METPSTGKRIIRAMIVVAFFHAFWKLGGFLLRLVLGHAYGLGDVTDAYTIALDGVVFAIFLIVEESMGPAFLPVFIYRLKEDGDKKAWEFGGTVFVILFALLSAVIGLGIFFSSDITNWVAPGFIDNGRHAAQAIASTLMRAGFPGLLGLGLGSLTYVILNAYKVFGYPAAADSVQKFTFVAVFALLMAVFGPNPLFIAVGFVAGAGGKLVVHYIGMKSKLVIPKIKLSLRSPDMRKFLVLLAPLLIGIIAAKFRDIITKGRFGSYLPAGQNSAIDWAKRVGDLPTLIFPYALSIAMFPYLCDMAQKKDYEQFSQVVTRTLRILALFFVPLTIATIVMKYPIIQFVYQMGNWTDANTQWTSLALGCYVIALVFYASETVVMQSFFSLQNTWIPVSVGLVSSSLQIAGLYAAITIFDLNRFYCVALAFPLSRILKNVILVALMKRKVPILPVRETAVYALKIVGISAAVGVAMYAADSLVGPALSGETVSAIRTKALLGARLAVASSAGITTFAILCFALHLEEAAIVVDWIKKEGWEKIRSKLGKKR